jgi:hypothetical protein
MGGFVLRELMSEGRLCGLYNCLGVWVCACVRFHGVP